MWKKYSQFVTITICKFLNKVLGIIEHFTNYQWQLMNIKYSIKNIKKVCLFKFSKPFTVCQLCQNDKSISNILCIL